MSKRDNNLLLLDMLESAEKIKKYCKGIDFDRFVNDEKTVDAVIRNFEVIGEAANRIDPDFQGDNPQNPWAQLRRYRNRLIHEYFGIDHKIVWEIISDDLDNLIHELDVMLGR